MYSSILDGKKVALNQSDYCSAHPSSLSQQARWSLPGALKENKATDSSSMELQGTTIVLCATIIVVVLVTAAAPFVFGGGRRGVAAESSSSGKLRNGGLSVTRCLQHSCTGLVLFAIDRFEILTKTQSIVGLSFGLVFVCTCWL